MQAPLQRAQSQALITAWQKGWKKTLPNSIQAQELGKRQENEY